MAICDTYFEHSSKAWQSVCWNVHTSSKFPNKDVNSTVLRLKTIYMWLQWIDLENNSSYLSLVQLADSWLITGTWDKGSNLYFNFCFLIYTNSVVLSKFLKILSLASLFFNKNNEPKENSCL